MLTLPIEHPKGRGEITLEVFVVEDEIVCGIYHLEGRLNLPLREWLRVMRETMAELEQRMKAAGVAELRLCGRNWARVFPDFQPNPAFPNGLKKRL